MCFFCQNLENKLYGKDTEEQYLLHTPLCRADPHVEEQNRARHSTVEMIHIFGTSVALARTDAFKTTDLKRRFQESYTVQLHMLPLP
jgi:hypothetical protein